MRPFYRDNVDLLSICVFHTLNIIIILLISAVGTNKDKITNMGRRS